MFFLTLILFALWIITFMPVSVKVTTCICLITNSTRERCIAVSMLYASIFMIFVLTRIGTTALKACA